MRYRPPVRVGILVIVLAGVVSLAVHRVVAHYPEPEIVQTSWQLELEHGQPKLIAVASPGETYKHLYAYIPYTVTNRTGRDQLFVPEFLLWTDAGDVIEGNRGINAAVFRAIAARERNPLLQEPAAAVGRILQGRDQARDSVVIWRVPDHDVDLVRVFIAGLSGETHVVTDAATGQTRTLRKNYMVEYATPGDEAHRADTPYLLSKSDWVIR